MRRLVAKLTLIPNRTQKIHILKTIHTMADAIRLAIRHTDPKLRFLDNYDSAAGCYKRIREQFKMDSMSAGAAITAAVLSQKHELPDTYFDSLMPLTRKMARMPFPDRIRLLTFTGGRVMVPAKFESYEPIDPLWRLSRTFGTLVVQPEEPLPLKIYLRITLPEKAIEPLAGDETFSIEPNGDLIEEDQAEATQEAAAQNERDFGPMDEKLLSKAAAFKAERDIEGVHPSFDSLGNPHLITRSMPIWGGQPVQDAIIATIDDPINEGTPRPESKPDEKIARKKRSAAKATSST